MSHFRLSQYPSFLYGYKQRGEWGGGRCWGLCRPTCSLGWAHVIATASARNSDFLRELGASEIIDYTSTRFEDMAHDLDVVFDTVGGDPGRS